MFCAARGGSGTSSPPLGADKPPPRLSRFEAAFGVSSRSTLRDSDSDTYDGEPAVGAADDATSAFANSQSAYGFDNVVPEESTGKSLRSAVVHNAGEVPQLARVEERPDRVPDSVVNAPPPTTALPFAKSHGIQRIARRSLEAKDQSHLSEIVAGPDAEPLQALIPRMRSRSLNRDELAVALPAPPEAANAVINVSGNVGRNSQDDVTDGGLSLVTGEGAAHPPTRFESDDSLISGTGLGWEESPLSRPESEDSLTNTGLGREESDDSLITDLKFMPRRLTSKIEAELLSRSCSTGLAAWVGTATDAELDALEVAIRVARRRIDIVGNLPAELLPLVFRFLGIGDVGRACQVSPAWTTHVSGCEQVWENCYREAADASICPNPSPAAAAAEPGSWKRLCRDLRTAVLEAQRFTILDSVGKNENPMRDKIFDIATIEDRTDGTVLVAAVKSSRVVLYRLRSTPLPYDGSRMDEHSGYFEPVLEIDCTGNSCRSVLSDGDTLFLGMFNGKIASVPVEAVRPRGQPRETSIGAGPASQPGLLTISNPNIRRVHTGAVLFMAMSSDSGCLISSSSDGTVRFWDLKTRRLSGCWTAERAMPESREYVHKVLAVGDTAPKTVVAASKGTVFSIDATDCTSLATAARVHMSCTDIATAKGGVAVASSTSPGITLLALPSLTLIRTVGSPEPWTWSCIAIAPAFVVAGSRLCLNILSYGETARPPKEPNRIPVHQPQNVIVCSGGCVALLATCGTVMYAIGARDYKVDVEWVSDELGLSNTGL